MTKEEFTAKMLYAVQVSTHVNEDKLWKIVEQLLADERERCAKLAEGAGLGRNCNPECHKAAAARIRESV